MTARPGHRTLRFAREDWAAVIDALVHGGDIAAIIRAADVTLVEAEPAPRPTYEAIASAIRNACELAAVQLEIRHDENPTVVADPYLKLARMLEQGGLIDAAGVGGSDA